MKLGAVLGDTTDYEIGPADINAQDKSHATPPHSQGWLLPAAPVRPRARACSGGGPEDRPADRAWNRVDKQGCRVPPRGRPIPGAQNRTPEPLGRRWRRPKFRLRSPDEWPEDGYQDRSSLNQGCRLTEGQGSRRAEGPSGIGGDNYRSEGLVICTTYEYAGMIELPHQLVIVRPALGSPHRARSQCHEAGSDPMFQQEGFGSGMVCRSQTERDGWCRLWVLPPSASTRSTSWPVLGRGTLVV